MYLIMHWLVLIYYLIYNIFMQVRIRVFYNNFIIILSYFRDLIELVDVDMVVMVCIVFLYLWNSFNFLIGAIDLRYRKLSDDLIIH